MKNLHPTADLRYAPPERYYLPVPADPHPIHAVKMRRYCREHAFGGASPPHPEGGWEVGGPEQHGTPLCL